MLVREACRPQRVGHVVLGLAQLGFVLGFGYAIDLPRCDRESDAGSQMFGHTLIGLAFVVCGVYYLTAQHTPASLVLRAESRVCVLGSAGYIVGELMTQHRRDTVLNWGGHLAFASLMIVVGLMLRLAARHPESKQRAPHMIIGVSWGLFAYLHGQKSPLSRQMHTMLAVWAVVGSLARVLNRFYEAAVAYILVGWLFFAAQEGLTYWVFSVTPAPTGKQQAVVTGASVYDHPTVEVLAWIFGWHVVGAVVVTAYSAVLSAGEAEGYGPVVQAEPEPSGSGSPQVADDML